MHIKSTVACALTLMAVASARPVNLIVGNNESNDQDNQSLEAQVQAELEQKLQDEQNFGDFSDITEKRFQSLNPLNEQFDFNAALEADADASLDFDALLEEQQTLIEHAEQQKAYIRPGSSACGYGPSSSSCYSDNSNPGSYCSSYGSSFGASTSSYGCPATSSYGCPTTSSYGCPALSSSGCPAPCPAPRPAPCALPCPAPAPIYNTGCALPSPCPPLPCPPCPLPQQYNPCFASPFADEFCDYSSSSSSSSCPSSSSSYSSSVSEVLFNINDYKFDVCGASVFGIVAQLRMIGLRYPNNPNAAQRTAFINYITGLINNFPCTPQRTIMSTYLTANSINVNDRKSFNKWAATFSKSILTEINFPLGLNLQGMFVPVYKSSTANNKRSKRK